ARRAGVPLAEGDPAQPATSRGASVLVAEADATATGARGSGGATVVVEADPSGHAAGPRATAAGRARHRAPRRGGAAAAAERHERASPGQHQHQLHTVS